ncbi:MarR family winged helix-turn-helix transcriptional regulator [uncultured Bifidobacterium sp.]|uniref:MarR family winged helix-turn-helix transcriptional regulator n=1 Tax=uncultured Bifidobacterium sp. TaxID=165187 RepID=UPI00261AB1C7|nr:MarR family winged helix-turn-helix transcriptional regulator [uncultured Bifidobacterium sp.]
MKVSDMHTDYGKGIKRAANLMARSMDSYAAGFGLTGRQLSIIDFLSTEGSHSQHDIEEEFDIRRSTATAALQRMEESGLVTTRRADHDGRQKVVTMTAKARGLGKAASDYIKAQDQAMEDRFSSKELDTFNQVLSYFIGLNSESDESQEVEGGHD